jgi:hypothetical protein
VGWRIAPISVVALRVIWVEESLGDQIVHDRRHQDDCDYLRMKFGAQHHDLGVPWSGAGMKLTEVKRA